jgi:flagellar biosynthetic protein FliR
VLVAAVQVCAPVLLAVVITDAAVGVVSRVMPQLNVFAVGFPAKILVGFLLVAASLPFVAGWIGDQLTKSVGAALHTLQVA